MATSEKFFMGETAYKFVTDNKMKSEFTSISKKELLNKYPKLTNEIEKTCKDNDQHFLLFPNGAIIDETLDINPVNDYDGIVVMDALKVKGNIVNTNDDYGTTLIVFGDTYADNLIAGGSIISLNGEAYIKYLCLAHYNGGILAINKLHASLFINDDHATGIKDITDLDAEFNTYYDRDLEVNQFNMVDLGIIFPDKPWIQIDTDEDNDEDETGFYYHFDPNTFMKHELTNRENIINIIKQVKEGIEQQKKLEDLYFNAGMASTDQLYPFITRNNQAYHLLYFPSLPKNSNVKLVKGDYVIENDLILDKKKYLAENICMLLIDGDLTVKGSIYNSYEEDGIILFVTGNVYCSNLVISTAEVFINKNLSIDNILLCGLPEYIDIDSGPDLRAQEIKSASLAIIESNYELRNRFGSNIKNKIFTVEKDRKEGQLLIKHLEKILDEKYWSKEDEYINEEYFWKAVVKNNPVLKPDYEAIIVSLLKKKKQIDPGKQEIVDIIECIKTFLDKHGIKYYLCEDYLKIVQPEISYEMYFDPVPVNSKGVLGYKLAFGDFPSRKYNRKKELDKYKLDLIYYLEKYLLNQVKLNYYKVDNKTIGDVLQVFDNEQWSEALGKPEFNAYLASESTSVESFVTQFTIDKDEISSIINALPK